MRHLADATNQAEINQQSQRAKNCVWCTFFAASCKTQSLRASVLNS